MNTKHRYSQFSLMFLILIVWFSCSASKEKVKKPNIIVILADDLGWGDVSCYQPGNAYKTPQIDRIAREGIRFTNAHTPHSVCTPTRYALLTGRYCWRTFVREGVLPGYSKPLIVPERMTLGSMHKQSGYTTGAFGKWHIGIGWKPVDGDPGDFHFGSQIHAADDALAEISKRVDHTAVISGGPIDLGFDTFFGTPSNRNRIPVFIRDNRVVGTPRRNDIGLIFDLDVKADKVDDIYAEEAVKFIEDAVRQKKPFFAYVAFNAIHGAVSVPKEFQGKSNVSSRTDKCLWLDRSVGRILDVLDRTGQADNTLLIFTSDNGPEANIGELKLGHDASGPYRGYKTDVWDGGSRVPFLVRWPGKVTPGRVNADEFCLTDVMATLASVIGQPLPLWAGEDSFNRLPVWLGEDSLIARGPIITQSYTGILSIRRDKWKLILDTKGSGGFLNYSPEVQQQATVAPWRPDMSQVGQLYDLENDPYETTDLYGQYPELEKELKMLLRKSITEGRTRAME
jgi:arylsulfatase A